MNRRNFLASLVSLPVVATIQDSWMQWGKQKVERVVHRIEEVIDDLYYDGETRYYVANGPIFAATWVVADGPASVRSVHPGLRVAPKGSTPLPERVIGIAVADSKPAPPDERYLDNLHVVKVLVQGLVKDLRA